MGRLLYDHDCGFCKRWVESWRELCRGHLSAVAYQDPAALEGVSEANRKELTFERMSVEIHWLDDQGHISRGAAAVFQALAESRGPRLPWWIYRKVGVFRAISEKIYGWVARHRQQVSRVRASDVLLRGIGLVYFGAFVSFAVQVRGLIGAQGILPVREWLGQTDASQLERFFLLPTLAWWFNSDALLVGGCVVGALCGLGLLLNPKLDRRGLDRTLAFIAWFLYLSYSHAGNLFMGYQWESLLLEVGVLALFLRRDGFERGTKFLLRLLLFKLMFLAGFAKISSGDPRWRSLTALAVHYETQPLPNPLAWVMHQAPMWVHMFSVAFALFVELVLPFGIFLGVRGRLAAFLGFAALQISIIATGNFGFFNYLSLLLGCCLFESPLGDNVCGWKPKTATLPEPEKTSPRAYARLATQSLVGFFSAWTLFQGVGGMLLVPASLQRPMSEILERTRVASPYGLFAVMTPDRPEIVVEGSRDGKEWLAYEFRYKPGNPARRPPWVTPLHMPRLDWQMWFEALGSFHKESWFGRFLQALLEGRKPVTDLLEVNPFEGNPPTYIRAHYYRYHMSHWGAPSWWVREDLGEFAPVMQLRKDAPGE